MLRERILIYIITAVDMSFSTLAIEAYITLFMFLYYTDFSMPLTPFEHHVPDGSPLVIESCFMVETVMNILGTLE